MEKSLYTWIPAGSGILVGAIVGAIIFPVSIAGLFVFVIIVILSVLIPDNISNAIFYGGNGNYVAMLFYILNFSVLSYLIYREKRLYKPCSLLILSLFSTLILVLILILPGIQYGINEAIGVKNNSVGASMTTAAVYSGAFIYPFLFIKAVGLLLKYRPKN